MTHAGIAANLAVPSAKAGCMPAAIIKGTNSNPPEPPIDPTKPVIRPAINNVARKYSPLVNKKLSKDYFSLHIILVLIPLIKYGDTII